MVIIKGAGRRRFLRLGGLAAATAAAPGPAPAATSAAEGDDPLEAWRGPSADANPLAAALSYAVLAANPNNRQPWLVEPTGPRSFLLYADQGRLLIPTDPTYRQVHIGQGTFLENLVVAAGALGLRADLRPFPAGEYGPTAVEHRPVAAVELADDPSAARDRLFDAILMRRTNRTPFDERPVAPAQLAALRAACAAAGLELRANVDPGAMRELTEAVVAAARVEMADHARLHELSYMARLDQAELRRYRDGADFTRLGARGVTRADLVDPASPDSLAAGNEGAHRLWAGTAAAFAWIATPANTRSDQVRAGRAYQRVALAAAAVGVAVQPHSQPLEAWAGDAHRALRQVVAEPEGRTVQMFFRLGHGAPGSPSARRRVTELMG